MSLRKSQEALPEFQSDKILNCLFSSSTLKRNHQVKGVERGGVLKDIFMAFVEPPNHHELWSGDMGVQPFGRSLGISRSKWPFMHEGDLLDSVFTKIVGPVGWPRCWRGGSGRIWPCRRDMQGMQVRECLLYCTCTLIQCSIA